MLLGIPGTVNFSQVQVYNNELINYVVINRGLSRLYDNDEAIATRLSGYVNIQFNELDTRMLEVENLAGDIGNIEDDVAQLQSNTSNYTQWNTTYSIVDANFADWNTAYTLVSSNSALWNTAGSGGSGVSELSALNDVNVGSLGVGQDGYSLVWNNSTETWVPSGIIAGSGGATVGDVSGIVEDYDAENEWSLTASEWQADKENILSATAYVTNTSSDFVNKTVTTGYTRNSYWIDNNIGTNSSNNLTRSFYNRLQTAEYLLSNVDLFATDVGGHNFKQNASIYVTQSVDLDFDLANENLSLDGSAGGGTPANLYLTMQYKAAKDATFNVPDGNIYHLSRLSGCTFGFDNIDTTNSYTMFDGFHVANCEFSGTVGQQFYFKNCYVELDTLTITNASEFYFDNSCTVDAGTFATDGVLTLKNKGIPTYSTNGTDPTTISGSFAGFTGPYIYNDTMVQP